MNSRASQHVFLLVDITASTNSFGVVGEDSGRVLERGSDGRQRKTDRSDHLSSP
ncbi:unnamed protein product, partial [Musa acuminata var. zebrina]